jgi:hypothetical protein
MQALKALVIVMGIVIVIGMGVIAVTLYDRLTARLGEEEPAAVVEAQQPAPAPARPRAFGTRELSLPRGARIEDMVAEGDRLILHLRLPGGQYQIMIVDLADGSRLGTLNLEPAP